MERLRSLRTTEDVRERNAEIHLDTATLIQPFFVIGGVNRKVPIPSLHGQFRYSVDQLVNQTHKILDTGIDKILLFGIVDDKDKDPTGLIGRKDDSLICRAVRALKESMPELTVITDVCLCAYSDHGHCGLVRDGVVLNDETLPLLGEMAVSHARAGADFVAPSAMMDGQVAFIKSALKKKGLNAGILSYSTKYASNFYGPFRDAVQSGPSSGDRKTYQCDYRTIGQGVRESVIDKDEGADWLMVKPGLAYLDMILRIRQTLPATPLAVYQVSGEYMSLKLLAENGLIDEQSVFEEVFTSFKRAGANYIISYYSYDYAKKLAKEKIVK